MLLFLWMAAQGGGVVAGKTLANAARRLRVTCASALSMNFLTAFTNIPNPEPMLRSARPPHVCCSVHALFLKFHPLSLLFEKTGVHPACQTCKTEGVMYAWTNNGRALGTGALARRQDIEIEVERFENARDAIYKVPLRASQLSLKTYCMWSCYMAVDSACLGAA